MASFGETVDLLGNIRSILENYPFSAGLLRELLQNSDDAKASHQTFALDYRTHPDGRLRDPRLSETQGPALLAFNNATFAENDWTALRSISASSKKEDTSKIGKFGIGIRSCYHITDFLQVLSGQDLVIFDPQRSFDAEGGVRLNFKENPESFEDVQDHVHCFSHFLPNGWNGSEPFEGTVVRLPLRTRPGEIREKIVKPEEIRRLFHDFIDGEIDIAMLFLRHLRSIDFIIIDKDGHEKRLASCTLDIETGVVSDVVKKRARVHPEGAQSREQEWLIVHRCPPPEEALDRLRSSVGTSCENALTKHKLVPDIGIAFPLPREPDSPLESDIGRLFTFLRLPIETGFPAHVHACFALTPSRQNLRNRVDNGIVRGSEDHILVEWNKILFETFIPRAWSQLLELLATEFPAVSIFSAWPASQSSARSGEAAYWQTLPFDVLKAILANRLPVWPVTGQGYGRLSDVFIAPPELDISISNALASAGLNICAQVPKHIYEMIRDNHSTRDRVLTPKRAADALRGNIRVSNLGNLGNPGIPGIILGYLLSSGNVADIVGIPIVPAVSGGFVSLSSSAAQPKHTLLEVDESELFGPCDSNAIRIDDLPEAFRGLFRTQGPSKLNVKRLDTGMVVQYLALHPTRNGVDLARTIPDAEALTFISRFWTWTEGWRERSKLVNGALDNVYLLPSIHGMKQADRARPVFDSEPIQRKPAVHTYLSNLGVPFLNGLERGAKAALTNIGLLKSPDDIDALLNSIVHPKIVGLSSDHAKLVLQHFNDNIPQWRRSNFSDYQASTFKKLPIFPSVEYDDVPLGDPVLRLKLRWISVEGLVVYGVQSKAVLPQLPNTVFLDCDLFSKHLLHILNPSAPAPLSSLDALSLTLKRLDQQPKKLLSSFLDYAVRSGGLTFNMLKSLRTEKFVLSASGSREAPSTLIDPLSPIYPLFDHDKHRQPRLEDALDREIVKSLSTLGLLDRNLSAGNIMDRIHYVESTPDSNSAFETSIKLLNIICQSNFDCTSLPLNRSTVWVPVQKGSLAAANGCRPAKGQTSLDDESLFDRVLDRVHSRVATISPLLGQRLGWNDPIPFSVLVRQLGHVLDDGQSDTVQRDAVPTVITLILELSKRTPLREEEWRSLKEVLEGRQWVPVSGTLGDQLVFSWQAVLSSPFQGIYQVVRILTSRNLSQEFLKKLGCSAKPTFESVRQRLQQLSGQPASEATSTAAVAALRFATSILALTDEEHSSLIVPDLNHHLRPIKTVIFNDVGARSVLAKLDGIYLANRIIDEDLARSLRLEWLGLMFMHTQSPGEDMGVSPATIVKKTLAQYTEKQFLPEFLANAEDAGASRFEVILCDHIPAPRREGYMTSEMRRLYSGPAVIVYNDSEFEERDFDGICRTHRGSKEDAIDSIGQFGLGALTMFHFAECAIIFSGESVLILDPTKRRLPIPGRASLKLPLASLIDQYPGHTDCLVGLHCYDESESRVNGTIFYLPLRAASHVENGGFMKSQPYTLGEFETSILQDFQVKAPNCLLFVNLSEVKASKRRSDLATRLLWSLEVSRDRQEHQGFTETKIGIQIQSRVNGTSVPRPGSTMFWRTVTTKVLPESIPVEVRINNSSRIVRVGLAASLTEDHQSKSKLFSTLPLAISIALPVHVNASFRLSSDRRQIRLDAYDNDDTRFNRWLLSQKLPLLYLELLERLSTDRDNARWWPGTHPKPTTGYEDDGGFVPTPTNDSLAAILIENFFSLHLPKAPHRVFRPMFFSDKCLQFPEVILSPSTKLPPVVQKAFDILRPSQLVKLTSIRGRLANIKATVAGPAFVKQILMENQGAQKVRTQLNEDEFKDLLVYLADPGPSQLAGLPLLRLEDQTWTTFQTRALPHYFSWRSEKFVKANLFSSQSFVFPAFIPTQLLQSPEAGSINVAKLDAEGIKRLTRERLETLAPQEKALWLDIFWRSLKKFPEEGRAKSIETLPLVPTMKDTVFKSLLQIKNGEAIVSSSLEPDWLNDCFIDLGLTVVNSTCLHANLRDLVRFGEYSSKTSTFGSFLRGITPVLDSAVRGFQTWPSARRNSFSEWVKAHISSGSIPEQFAETARRLPIWAARRGSEESFRSADEVALLPAATPITIGRFCSQPVTADAGVIHLNRPRKSLAQLYGELQLPNILAEGEDETVYRDFVRQILGAYSRREDIPRLKVPTTARTMVFADTLYEHSDFFDAAFGDTSPHFLLLSFSTMFSHGLPLIRDTDQNVNHEVFRQCAVALQEDTSTDKAERARVLFQRYYNRLALRNPSQRQPGTWRTLDHLEFIPRNVATTRRYLNHEIELPARIRQLPAVVSPREVVRDKEYAVSWTQRAALAEQPRTDVDTILLVFPEFGRPTGEEVVAHLRALVQLPRSPIILHDLKETYKWLNTPENLKLIKSTLAQLGDVPIFLNVDDPDRDEWTWCAANQLALETHDLSTVRAVRQFLTPYRRLLKAAGVLEAFYPDIERADDGTLASQENTFLHEMRRVFNEQRVAGQLTDVVFLPREDGTALGTLDGNDSADESSGDSDYDDASEDPTLSDDEEDTVSPSSPEVASYDLRGHRSFLSACSPFFRSMFTGSFREGQRDATSQHPQTVGLPQSGFAIEAALDYCYTGKAFTGGGTIELDDLMETLALANYLELIGLFNLAQDQVAIRKLVDPQTLHSVRTRAEELSATRLKRYCNDLPGDNGV
ncbi:hypothetical protein DFP72DRAFT_893244 [Ephemerocybe angulata]|uniref:BTB domain-containing protein n=1 Tax=Ephemerocybe angulata TaxID=980116 RepID=A0A8H6M5N0_9AGAR|nr:hypothetical protein DFP72DRAFT_893244 [Tulosesus angulatus]